jgi:hypothetical protein
LPRGPDRTAFRPWSWDCGECHPSNALSSRRLRRTEVTSLEN